LLAWAFFPGLAFSIQLATKALRGVGPMGSNTKLGNT
jgi:hypothetical protein